MTTRNLVPRADNEGKIGISTKKWSEVNSTTGIFSTIKVSSLKLNAEADLGLFVAGPGISEITTNVDNQFVISLDSTLLQTSLGFNADGSKPNFTVAQNSVINTDDSIISAIENLDASVRDVAAPTNLTIASFENAAITTSQELFADNDTTLMTSAAIDDRILSYGYTTNTGDITSVNITAGTGLQGSLNTADGDHTQTLSLADTAVVAGDYGSGTQIPTFSVDAQGRLTAAGTANISTSFNVADNADVPAIDIFNVGETLTFAGGTGLETAVTNNRITTTLSDTAVAAGNYGSATQIPTFTVDAQGRLTAAGSVGVTTVLTVDSDNAGTQDVSLADDDLQILGGTGLTSAVAKANNEVSITLSLDDTAVAAGQYGDANSIGQFTVDSQGRLTQAANIDIEIPKTQITNFDEEVQDIVASQVVSNGSHTGITASYDDANDGAIDLVVNGLTLTEFAPATVQTEAEVTGGGGIAGFADNDSSLLTAAAIKQFVDAQNFGDISQVNITAGTGLEGTVNTESGAHNQTIALANTAVAAGDYGSATQTVAISVDAQGRLTSAANTNIEITSNEVLDFEEAAQDIVGIQLATNGSHSGISASYDDANDGAIDLTVLADTANIQNSAITADKINDNIISGQNEIIAGLSLTDELLLSDDGVLKKMDLQVLKTYFDKGGDAELSFTTNTDEDVSVSNLETRLGEIDSNIQIGVNNTVQVTIPGNLVVTGTTTTNNVETVSTTNGVIFEGNNVDDHQITLLASAVTADRIITLPDVAGHVALLSTAATETITATPAELNLLDGSVANTVVAGKAVIYSNELEPKIKGDLVGNASTATVLETTREIAITGDVSGSANFDGSADISINATIGELSVDNSMLAGAIANDKLANSSVSLGGVSISLGGTDATPAFDLADATNLPTTSLTGTITNAQLAGAIADGKLAEDYLKIGEVDNSSIEVNVDGNLQVKSSGITNGMLVGAIADSKLAEDYLKTSEVDDSSIEVNVDGNLQVKALGITNNMLSGAIANVKLSNSSISLGGVSVSLGGSDATPAFNLSDATNLPTTSLTGTITNAQLAGSIANDKLSNSSISLGGVSIALGSTDATPAFNLADATNLPTTSLTGTITNAQLAGAIANDKLSNSSISLGGVNISLGGTDATPAFDLSDATNLPTTSLTGTITNAQLAGAIANAKLVNDSISLGGVSVALGGTDATPAFDLSDAINLPTTSLTGTITNAQLAGTIADDKLAEDYIKVSEVDDSSIEVNVDGNLQVKSSGITNDMLSGTIADGKLAEDYIKVSEVDDSSIEVNVDGNLQVKDSGVSLAKIENLSDMSVIGNTSGNEATPSEVVIKDEDDMASDSATALVTQQSVKAFVEGKLGRHGGMFKTSSDANSWDGVNNNINRDVEFSGSPIVRSHFGPFAFSLNDLHTLGGSDIIFYGSTSTVASDRHFEVSYDSNLGRFDTIFTGANSNTP